MNREVQIVPEGREVARHEPPGEEVVRCKPGPVEGDRIQQQNTQGQALSFQVTMTLCIYLLWLVFVMKCGI